MRSDQGFKVIEEADKDIFKVDMNDIEKLLNQPIGAINRSAGALANLRNAGIGEALIAAITSLPPERHHQKF